MAKHIGLAECSKNIIYASGAWSGHRIFINASCDSFNVLETTSQPLAILIMWRSRWNKSRAGIWACEECGNSTLARLAFCGVYTPENSFPSRALSPFWFFHLECFFSAIWVVFSLLRSYSHVVYFGRLFFLVPTNTSLVLYFIIFREYLSGPEFISIRIYTPLSIHLSSLSVYLAFAVFVLDVRLFDIRDSVCLVC